MSRVLVMAFLPALAASASAKTPVKLKPGDVAPQFARSQLQGHLRPQGPARQNRADRFLGELVPTLHHRNVRS